MSELENCNRCREADPVLVEYIDSISEDASDSPYYPKTQMEWVEIGDVTSIGDLYDNNFINTDMDRE